MIIQVFARKYRINGDDDMSLYREYKTEREAEQAAAELRRQGWQTAISYMERGRYRDGRYESEERG